MSLNLKYESGGIREPSLVDTKSNWSLQGLAGSLSACVRMAASSSTPTSAFRSTYFGSMTSTMTVGAATIPAAASTSTSAAARPNGLGERRRSVEFDLSATTVLTTTSTSTSATTTTPRRPTEDKEDEQVRDRSLSLTWEISDSEVDLNDEEVVNFDDEDDDDELTDDDLAVNPIDPARPQTQRSRRRAQQGRRRREPRLRITFPTAANGGWMRGQAADVHWDVLDPRVKFVRIDVYNEHWSVPTTIAHRVPNNGSFHWSRVYWGLPIRGGYFLNVYDVTNVPAPATPLRGLQVISNPPSPDAVRLATSELFSVVA